MYGSEKNIQDIVNVGEIYETNSTVVSLRHFIIFF